MIRHLDQNDIPINSAISLRERPSFSIVMVLSIRRAGFPSSWPLDRQHQAAFITVGQTIEVLSCHRVLIQSRGKIIGYRDLARLGIKLNLNGHFVTRRNSRACRFSALSGDEYASHRGDGTAIGMLADGDRNLGFCRNRGLPPLHPAPETLLPSYCLALFSFEIPFLYPPVKNHGLHLHQRALLCRPAAIHKRKVPVTRSAGEAR